MVNPTALCQLRKLLGLTQAEFADRVDLAQEEVSMYEAGYRTPSLTTVQLICERFRVPAQFLLRDVSFNLGEGSLGLFRSHQSKLTSRQTDQVRAFAGVGCEVYQTVQSRLRPLPVMPRPTSKLKPEEGAALVRRAFGIAPDCPIKNLTQSAEANGFRVFLKDFSTDDVFGFSTWFDSIPVITMSTRQTAYRFRFTLAHEIGHLILSHDRFFVEPKQAEHEANRFASELLTPAEAITPELALARTLRDYLHIKGKWGVSVGALIYRAMELGVISRERHVAYRKELSRLGWTKLEPLDSETVSESPRILRLMAERVFGDDFEVRFPAEMGFPDWIISEVIAPERSQALALVIEGRRSVRESTSPYPSAERKS